MLLFASPLAGVYLLTLAVLLGLVMGSALNCLAWRMAHGEKWSGGRSRCPQCGHELNALDLVPLFSYLFLRGRCRYCGERISPRYALAELTLGLTYGAVLLMNLFIKHFGTSRKLKEEE